jgi:hypothetical protein
VYDLAAAAAAAVATTAQSSMQVWFPYVINQGVIGIHHGGL